MSPLGLGCVTRIVSSACTNWQIVLQKSKVAGSRIFRENTKREAIADLYRRNRVVEVACEFSVRR
jgi:hypothetical protein